VSPIATSLERRNIGAIVTTNQAPFRLLIAGGGTGGHVFPAVAVVEEIRARQPQTEFFWIGSHKGVEGRIAAEHSIPFRAVQMGKLRRYFDVENIKDVFRFPVGIAQAWPEIGRFRPDVIFSTGGHASVPSVIAGWTRRVPILTHEQTAQIGMANRISARFASSFAVSFAESVPLAQRVHKRVVLTGNPVRTSLLTGNAERGRMRYGFTADLPILYVTGGAQGATRLNAGIEPNLPALLERMQIVHQAGPAAEENDDAARLAAFRETLPDPLKRRYVITEFVRDELPDVFAMADLVVSRSGAGTVAELELLGKPSILVPLPGTGGDEATKNARVLERAGAAVVVEQKDATPERLAVEIDRLLADRARLASMAAAAKAMGREDAAASLADELFALRRS
jgi:UDP-N-acetylglucosamine--N-acetylmuramyl-(pentapeptide) pyrophosphoryl-undecaprenol N-acetylglucosamine transferase